MKATKLDKLIAEMAVEMYEIVPHEDIAWVFLKQLGNRIVEIRRQTKKAKKD